MSEKELRAAIGEVRHCLGDVRLDLRTANQRLDKAVADDPDVVTLGHKLQGLIAERQADFRAKERSAYDLEHAVGRSFEHGALSALEGVVTLLEQLFHVRLTNGGWEYTD